MYIYYNITMNDRVKQMAREILQPVFDKLVDTFCTMLKNIEDNLPADMPESEKEQNIKQILDAQAQSMTVSMKNIIPEDFANKLKEAVNGRK